MKAISSTVKESQHSGETLGGSKSKAPAPSSPNLFFYPHLRPTLAKKSASTCKIRKDRLQKYPKRRSHQEPESCCRRGKSMLTAATPPAVDHHSSSSSSRSSSPSPHTVSCSLLQHRSSHKTVCCKCKRCRPQQRLHWLFQKLTPL